MHEAPENLKGITIFTDDILVLDTGMTINIYILKKIMIKTLFNLKRFRKINLKLNKLKLRLKQKSVTYLEHLITRNGLAPDTKKIKAINDMKAETD